MFRILRHVLTSLLLGLHQVRFGVQQQCRPLTFSLVTSNIGLPVCPVQQSDVSMKGSGSRANCLSLCLQHKCVSYNYQVDTTNCELYLTLATYYEPVENCFNYQASFSCFLTRCRSCSKLTTVAFNEHASHVIRFLLIE